jgi:aspartyl/asparaginyl beta-hydroxylase (cupin superfamily)
MLPAQASELQQAGIRALHRRDPIAALQAFDAVSKAGRADAATHLGRAYALAMQENVRAAQTSADAALALEPLNLRALLLKADLFHATGDGPAAASFYLAVVKAAEQSPSASVELRAEVERAQALAERYQSQLKAALERALESTVSNNNGVSSRFRQSVDILLGRRQAYPQQPKHYFFPELAAVQFHPREKFPWLPQVESATNDIRTELQALLQDESAFVPYVQRDPARPALSAGGMFNNPDWSALYLWKNGEPVAENESRCPRTMNALRGLPLTQVPGRSPSILFSMLRPGAHIPAHVGFVNTRLICHLPLIVPEGCSFRVGNETRHWVEGQAWVFDDTIEHEAWNRSDLPRVILLFEVWQPELTAAERAAVSELFSALDSHPGAKADWGI